MDETTGFVICTRSQSHLNKKRQLLEIELYQKDMQLLDWQNKKVQIKKIK